MMPEKIPTWAWYAAGALAFYFLVLKKSPAAAPRLAGADVDPRVADAVNGLGARVAALEARLRASGGRAAAGVVEASYRAVAPERMTQDEAMGDTDGHAEEGAF